MSPNTAAQRKKLVAYAVRSISRVPAPIITLERIVTFTRPLIRKNAPTVKGTHYITFKLQQMVLVIHPICQFYQDELYRFQKQMDYGP